MRANILLIYKAERAANFINQRLVTDTAKFFKTRNSPKENSLYYITLKFVRLSLCDSL